MTSDLSGSQTAHPDSFQADPPLRHAPVAYVVGGTLSMLGNSAIAVVLPWLVLTRTGDVSATALVATAAGIAAVPATLLGGRLADRFGARRLAIAADLGSVVSVLALGIVDAVVGLNIGWFVALGIAGALFDVPGMAARQSLLGDVARVGGRTVETVAGAFQAGFSLALLAGPALAGLLMANTDPINVVWMTAACSGVAAVATLAVPVPNPSQTQAAAPGSGAWRTITANGSLIAVVVIAFTAAMAGPALMSVILPSYFAELGRPGVFGTVVSAFAVGNIVGAVLYSVVAARSRMTTYLLSIVAMTVGMATTALLGPPAAVGAGMAVAGFGSGLFGPIWNVFIAENVPTAVRTQVLSGVNAVGLLGGPIGLGILTVVLSRADIQTAGFGVAAIWMVVGLFAVLSPAARGLAARAPAAPVPTA